MSVIDINDAFSGDFIGDISKLTTVFLDLESSIEKMATNSIANLNKTGEAYLQNKKLITSLIELHKSKANLEKERNKATALSIKLEKEKNKTDTASIKLEKEKTKAETTSLKLQKEKTKTDTVSLKLEKEKNKETEKSKKVTLDLLKSNIKLRKSQKELNDAKKNGKSIGESFIKVLEAQKKVVSDTAKKNGKLSDEYAKQKTILNGIQTEQKKFNTQQKKAKKESEILDGSLEQLSAELGKLKEQYRKVGAEGRSKLLPSIKKLNTQVNKLDANIGNFQRNVGNYSSAFKKLSGAASTLGISMGAATIVMKSFEQLKKSIEIIKEFEKSMSELKAVSGATDEEMQKLKQTALDLGRNTTFTATEVAQLEFEMSKLGFTAKEITDAAEGTLALAQATGADLGRTAEVAGATLRGYGIQATEMGRVTDVMALSFSSSALDLEKFAESMKLVAPIAKAANVDLEIVTAMLGNLADAGLSGSIAGTSLKNLLSKLSDENSSLSKELGFSVKNSDDLVRAFQVLKEKNIDLTEATGLTDERSKAAFLTMINGVDAIEDLSLRLYDAENAFDGLGAAQGMAQIMTDNFDGSVKRLNSAWEGMILGIQAGNGEIGNTATGFLDLIADILNLATETNALGRQFDNIITPLMDLFDIFKIVGDIFSVFSNNSEDATNSVGGLAKIFDVLIFTTKLGTAPLTLLIKYFKFLAQRVKQLFEKSPEQMAKFRDILDRIKEVASKVINVFKSFYEDSIKPMIGGMNESGVAVEIFKGILDSLIFSLSSTVKFYENIINLLGLLKKENEGVVQSFENFQKVLPSIGNTISSFFDEEQYKAEINNLVEQNTRIVDSNEDVIESNNDLTESNDELTKNFKKNAISRNTLFEKYNLYSQLEQDNLKVREAFSDLNLARDLGLLSEEEYLRARQLLREQYNQDFGDTDIFRVDDTDPLADLRNATTPEVVPGKMEEETALILQELEARKQAYKELYEYISTNAEKIAEANIKRTQDEIKKNEDVIDSTNKELQNEIENQRLRQEAGVAYDTEKIDQLNETLAEEQRLKKENQKELVRQENRLAVFQLATDQAKAISSLIAASNGNPANLLTGGIAGKLQFITGLISIITNFAVAKSKLKKYGKGGMIKDGKLHSQGGVDINAEKGEFVLRREAVKNIGSDNLELLNQGVFPVNFDSQEVRDTYLDVQRNNYLEKIANKKERFQIRKHKTSQKFR